MRNVLVVAIVVCMALGTLPVTELLLSPFCLALTPLGGPVGNHGRDDTGDETDQGSEHGVIHGSTYMSATSYRPGYGSERT